MYRYTFFTLNCVFLCYYDFFLYFLFRSKIFHSDLMTFGWSPIQSVEPHGPKYLYEMLQNCFLWLKTSPQAKRHKLSLLFTSLTFLTFRLKISSACCFGWNMVAFTFLVKMSLFRQFFETKGSRSLSSALEPEASTLLIQQLKSPSLRLTFWWVSYLKISLLFVCSTMSFICLF